MKTRHNFQPGDLIRAGERTGLVIHRGLINNRDLCIVQWDDNGQREVGPHSKLWMCDSAEQCQ